MKKLVLMFVAVAALTFASCGNGSKTETPAQDSDSIAQTDTLAGDSLTGDSLTADSTTADTTVAQ